MKGGKISKDVEKEISDIWNEIRMIKQRIFRIEKEIRKLKI